MKEARQKSTCHMISFIYYSSKCKLIYTDKKADQWLHSNEGEIQKRQEKNYLVFVECDFFTHGYIFNTNKLYNLNICSSSCINYI